MEPALPTAESSDAARLAEILHLRLDIGNYVWRVFLDDLIEFARHYGVPETQGDRDAVLAVHIAMMARIKQARRRSLRPA